MSTFAVGIDLGTTNCAAASAPFSSDKAVPEAFPIPQVVSPGEVAAEVLLPSFLYVAAPGELPEGALGLPWDPDARAAVGRFARDHGAAAPTKLIASAKSWLSYDGVDRRAPILPWGAPDEVLKLSPLGASIRYLGHVLEAWDDAHPDALLADQDVVLTVPASFDAVARDMTMEAARLAGLGERARLLEEPVAALYAWAAERGADWRKEVAVGDTILVVDIGGGTTDLSLIAVAEEDGRLALNRVAVGDHILLGGDNMDLALAWTVRTVLEDQGKRIDDWQMRALTHQCREAKEALLTDPDRQVWPLSLVSRGSKMFGGAIRTELTRAQLEGVLLEGFFPRVGADARPVQQRRSGLTTIGLPYAQDAAITRHLAAFLGRESLPKEPGQSLLHPSAILFNGGVTRSGVLRQRVVELIGQWATAEGGTPPRVLEGHSPDDAVARGAAYYAWARRRGGVRIRGGTARAHYVGIERAGLAIPGMPPRVDAVCIAPQGMEEGSETQLDTTFGLVVGEPVSFRFFAGERPQDALGAVVPPADLDELSPIEAQLEGPAGTVLAVSLQARVTEVGTLELNAVEDSGKRWKLSFDVSVR